MPNATLLIVDDEETILFNLISFFEDEGYVAHGAESGEEGLKMLEKYTVDLVVVDMRLPGMDGNTFIKEAQKLYPHLHYLIHTGSTDYTIPKALTKLGITADQILFKPVVNTHVLINKVEKYLEKKGE